MRGDFVEKLSRVMSCRHIIELAGLRGTHVRTRINYHVRFVVISLYKYLMSFKADLSPFVTRVDSLNFSQGDWSSDDDDDFVASPIPAYNTRSLPTRLVVSYFYLLWLL